MTRETLITVEQITRDYGNYRAVDNVSFTVERGDVLGFLGPNGAGKTTTMQIISGVLAATTGTVSIVGFDILDFPRQAKSHLGFLPEVPPLYTDLTVDEYLAFAARLRGITRSKMSGAVENSKQRCGLNDTGKRLIGNLSRGFQQRVSIAQAIIHSPAVLILDEPTGGLDPIQIHEIRQLIRELGNKHGVILSTHILPEVQTVCNRVIIIHEGRLVLDKHLDRLHEDSRKNTIRAAFKRPPSPETLHSISGIKSLDQVNEHTFLIDLDPESQALEVLLQRAVNSCWGLYELIPDTDSLEETFLQLTLGEEDNIKAPGKTA
jgi:ABC-2 type transport system ATP-binding protein